MKVSELIEMLKKEEQEAEIRPQVGCACRGWTAEHFLIEKTT